MSKVNKTQSKSKQKSNLSASQSADFFAQIRQDRQAKAAKLKAMGINPVQTDPKKDQNNKEICQNFAKYEGKILSLTGEITSWDKGENKVWADLRDDFAQIKVCFKPDSLEATNRKEQILGFDNLDLVDIADFVEVKGQIFKTPKGKVAVLVHQLRMIKKNLKPYLMIYKRPAKV